MHFFSPSLLKMSSHFLEVQTSSQGLHAASAVMSRLSHSELHPSHWIPSSSSSHCDWLNVKHTSVSLVMLLSSPGHFPSILQVLRWLNLSSSLTGYKVGMEASLSFSKMPGPIPLSHLLVMACPLASLKRPTAFVSNSCSNTDTSDHACHPQRHSTNVCWINDQEHVDHAWGSIGSQHKYRSN
jgi:hypothetical protein